MAADLTGLTPGGTDATFKWLAHFGANGAFPADGGTPQLLYKGDGTPSPLSFTATKAFVNGNEIFSGDPAIKEDKQPASLAVTDETTFNESYLDASAFGTIVEPDALVQYIYLPAGTSGDVRKSLTIRAPHGDVYINDGDGMNYLGLVEQGSQQRFRAASWDGGLSYLRYEPVGLFGSLLEAAINAISTIAGAKAFSGQVSMTGQTVAGATSALTAGLGVTLPISLRTGDAWDYVESDFFQIITTAWLANERVQFKLFASNIDTSYETQGISIYAPGSPGVGMITTHTGAAKDQNVVGLRVPSLNGHQAGVGGGLPPLSKWVYVARYKLPTAANRAGRLYYLAGANPYYTGSYIASFYSALRFNGSSNALEFETMPGGAITTASGAVFGGTFVAWSISDVTREILFRVTYDGSSHTYQIAAYSLTPTWITVYVGTGPLGLINPVICPDGSGTGAAAGAANEFRVISGHVAAKFT